MMRFHLRHRNQEVGAEHGIRQVELFETGWIAFRLNVRHVVDIEVYKQVFEFRYEPEIPGGIRQIQGVAAVAGTFGDAHACRTYRQEGLTRGMNHEGVRVDRRLGIEFDQVWLQDHPLTAHVQVVRR